MAEKTKAGGLLLPVARIKTIMKSSPEVSAIGQEALFLITKATELFIQNLSQTCLARSENHDSIEYTDLANIVNENETMLFLQDIVPKKVKVRDYYAMLGRSMPNSIASNAEQNEDSS